MNLNLIKRFDEESWNLGKDEMWKWGRKITGEGKGKLN